MASHSFLNCSIIIINEHILHQTLFSFLYMQANMHAILPFLVVYPSWSSQSLTNSVKLPKSTPLIKAALVGWLLADEVGDLQ